MIVDVTATSRDEPAVVVRNVSKAFRPRRGWKHLFRQSPRKIVLDSIDFEVSRGEVFGLLGPNGAGKTTLIKILCGLVIPDSGDVQITGTNLHRHDPDAHRTVGVVYGDERSFHWRLSVAENLEFFARLYGMPRSVARTRIAELIELVGLGHAGNERMLAFSSGMKQRASIARGMLHDPTVVLMDEPTRMLDPVGAHDLQKLVHERIAGDGRTVIVATNLMAEAEAMCDRLLLLNHGKTLLTGTLAEFRAELDPIVTYRFVVEGIDTRPHKEVDHLAGVRQSQRLPGVGDTVQLNVEMDDQSIALPMVIRSLLEAGGEIVSVEKETASLDQIFRQVVRRPQPCGSTEPTELAEPSESTESSETVVA